MVTLFALIGYNFFLAAILLFTIALCVDPVNVSENTFHLWVSSTQGNVISVRDSIKCSSISTNQLGIAFDGFALPQDHVRKLPAIGFTPDSSRLVTTTGKGQDRVFDISSGEPILANVKDLSILKAYWLASMGRSFPL